jgi:DnaJ-class molecular chaperone
VSTMCKKGVRGSVRELLDTRRGDTGMKQTPAHCARCSGVGKLWQPQRPKRKRPGHFKWERCPYCAGTGREPIPDTEFEQ